MPELGLIDKIGYADDAYTKAAAMAGLSKQQVVRYQRSPSLLDLLTGDSKRKEPARRSQREQLAVPRAA